MHPDADTVTRPPAIQDRAGRAWLMDVAGIIRDAGLPPEIDATVASWVIEAPWAHPLWHSYWLCLIHLRPLPNDTVGPRMYLEGATHELWLSALDPDEPRQPAIETGRLARLTPANFHAQLICANDAAAMSRAEAAVVDICHGVLSPDTDFIQQWGARFGRNMMK